MQATYRRQSSEASDEPPQPESAHGADRRSADRRSADRGRMTTDEVLPVISTTTVNRCGALAA
jgi:hypothetical protein